MKKVLKLGFVLVGITLLLGALAIGGLLVTFSMRTDQVYDVAGRQLAVSTTTDAVSRGHHLALTMGCLDCHGPNLAGRVIMDEPPIGRIVSTNLTTGKNGRGGVYRSAQDWDLAIRHGVRADDKKTLIFMPSREFYGRSDAEISDLIAYLKSVPPADSDLAPTRLGVVAKILDVLNMFDADSARRVGHFDPRPNITPGPTKEFGRLLAMGCVGCHGDGLSGGPIPGAPPSMPIPKNITPDEASGIGSWTEPDLVRALKEGVRPDGTAIDPFMPTASTKHFTSDEMRALYLFLRSVPPKPFGER